MTKSFTVEHKIIKKAGTSISWSGYDLHRRLNTGIMEPIFTNLSKTQVAVDGLPEFRKQTNCLQANHRGALFNVKSQLALVPGVSSVRANHDDRNLFVRIIPENLIKYEISVPQVRQALSQFLAYEPLGQISWNGESYGVQMKAQELSQESILDLPLISNRTGSVVRMKDIAYVEWDAWERQTRSLWNGKVIATIDVYKDIPSDSIALHKEVKEKVRELSETLVAPLAITEAFDGPRFIRKQIEVLSFNGWFGFFLIVVLLTVFLGFRTALMTAWSLPIAYLATFIVLSWLGISIDLLSILGLILVVGILVDDAIIVSDRYNDHLSKGLAPKEAAYLATRELIVPVTGTILTTLVAFLPLLLIPSNLTWFLKAIPLIVIISLAMSWADSFFVLPNHLSHFVRRGERPAGHKVILFLQNKFERSLRFCLRYHWAFMVVLLLGSVSILYVAGKKMQHHFNISIGSEQIVIYASLVESSSLDETIDKLQPILDYVGDLDKELIEFSSAQIGRYHRDGEVMEGFRFASITLGINGNHPRPIEIRTRIQPEITEALEKLKTEDFELLTSEERKRGEEDYFKNMVAVHVYGQDEAQFSQIEEEIRNRVGEIPNLTPRSSGNDQSMHVWTFDPDLSKLSRYSLSRQEVSAQIREHISAFEVGQIRLGGESVSLLTQIQYPEKIKFNELSSIPVISRLGEQVPLSWLGEWDEKIAPKRISHHNGLRYSQVRFRYDDEHFNIETAQAAIAAQLADIRQSHPSFDISVHSANRRDDENKKWITNVTFYAFVGVAVVLIVLLGSFLQPLMVIAPVPLGILGAILALYLHGMPITLMAMIGFMGVIGVAVNASIVLTHHLNRLRAATKHLSSTELVVAAAKSRLRAIMLTSVTTLCGLFPTAYGIFGESGFTQPIAFTMAWGLFASTLATLYVLPVLLNYQLFVSEKISLIFKGTKQAEVFERGLSEESGIKGPNIGYDSHPQKPKVLTPKVRTPESEIRH